MENNIIFKRDNNNNNNIDNNNIDANDITNNGWDKNKEKILRYWKEESQIMIWLNTQALNKTKFINKYFSIPSIFISAISSATLFSNINISQDKIQILIIFIGILLIISTFLQSLKEFLNLDKNIRQYITIIKNNQIIILDIQEQLNQQVNDRINGKKFLNDIKNKKNELIKNSIGISQKIYKKMERAIENGEIINYNDTFILYNYLQNKLTDSSILDNSNFNINNFNNHNHNNNENYDENCNNNININNNDENEIIIMNENNNQSMNQNNNQNKYLKQLKYQICRL